MLVELARSLNIAIRARRLKLGNKRLARRIASMTDYVFTEDYVSSHASVWQEYLAPFKGEENLRFLEVGSLEGRSAIWFLENILTHPTASITCVDPFLWRYREPRFDHNIEVSGFAGKVIKIKGKSEEILGTLEEQSFDIVYIDGCHVALNVMMDAMLGWLLLKPQGILIFDDYAWQPEKLLHNRPKMAIDAFLKVLQTRVEILHKGYQVVLKKPVGLGVSAAPN